MAGEDRGDDAIRLVVSFPKKMNQCMKGYADKYLKDTRLKPPYLILIFHIGKRDGLSQKELIDEVPYDKSYISNMVHELIDMGLVSNDGSGKVHSLHLTDSGRDIQAMSQMMFELIDRDLFTVLTDEERNALDSIMRKLNRRVDEILDELGGYGHDTHYFSSWRAAR